MKLTITRIPLYEITYKPFVNTYLIPEKPVILTGVDAYNENEITFLLETGFFLI